MSSEDYFNSGGSSVPKITLNSPPSTRANSSSRNDLSNFSSRLQSPVRSQRDYLKNNIPAYKQIKIDTSSNPFHTPNLKNSVSFDTVALDFMDENARRSRKNLNETSLSDDDDDDYDQERSPSRHDPSLSDFLRPGRGGGTGGSINRLRSPSPFRDASPMRTNSFSSVSNIEGGFKNEEPIYVNGWRVDYPTRSDIEYDSFVQVFRHPNYDDYVKTTEDQRTMVVYITGRRHTWVALDYVVANLLQSGDHIVVMTRVPSNYVHKLYGKKTLNGSNEELEENENDDNKERNKEQIDPDLFKGTSRRLKKYIEFLVGDQKIVKFTLDIALYESTTKLLKSSIKIYEPCTIITSTKPNLKFERKHTWKTSRITDRLVKNFEIPIIVVPAFTLNEFEISFFDKLIEERNLVSNIDRIKQKLKEFDVSSSTIPSIPSTRENNLNNSLYNSRNGSVSELVNNNDNSGVSSEKEDHDVDNDDSQSDESSILSDDTESSDDTSSIRDLTRTISSYKDVLEKYIEDTEHEPITSNTFLEKLNKVTDISHKISLKFSETSNGGGEGAALVRSLTGLPELTKKKSMLDVLEPAKTNDEALRKIKNSLYANGRTASSSNTPHLTTHSGGSSTPSRTIKFSNDAATPDRLKVQTNTDMNALRKFKTHVEQSHTSLSDRDDEGRSLSPSRSQPQSSLIKSLSESKVKTLGNSNDDLSLRSSNTNGSLKSKRKKFKDFFKKSKK